MHKTARLKYEDGTFSEPKPCNWKLELANGLARFVLDKPLEFYPVGKATNLIQFLHDDEVIAEHRLPETASGSDSVTLTP